VLGVQFNVTECELALTPDPDSEMMGGDLLRRGYGDDPVRFPAAAGAKATSNAAFCPGARIIPPKLRLL